MVKKMLNELRVLDFTWMLAGPYAQDFSPISEQR